MAREEADAKEKQLKDLQERLQRETRRKQQERDWDSHVRQAHANFEFIKDRNTAQLVNKVAGDLEIVESRIRTAIQFATSLPTEGKAPGLFTRLAGGEAEELTALRQGVTELRNQLLDINDRFNPLLENVHNLVYKFIDIPVDTVDQALIVSGLELVHKKRHKPNAEVKKDTAMDAIDNMERRAIVHATRGCQCNNGDCQPNACGCHTFIGGGYCSKSCFCFKKTGLACQFEEHHKTRQQKNQTLDKDDVVAIIKSRFDQMRIASIKSDLAAMDTDA